MPNIAYSNAIVAGDVPLATVVSNNFTDILAVVNSSGLDSINYKVSGIGSANITTGAIVSQHISNSQVVGAHISNSQIVHAKMQFLSASSGARILQIAASNSMKAYGLELIRASGSHVMTAANTYGVTASWTNIAIDGGPRSWTVAPNMLGAPAVYVTDTDMGFGPRVARYQAINSHNVAMHFSWSATVNGAFTWQIAAIGEPTG